MRKALIVGLNYYDTRNMLPTCVSDAQRVEALLKKNSNGIENFSTSLMIGQEENSRLSGRHLKISLMELFLEATETALFYYSGYGYFDHQTGYIITSDCFRAIDGVSTDDLLMLSNKSKAKNKIIILDLFHSISMEGTTPVSENLQISEGTTLLISYKKYQEEEERFTTLLCRALAGAAANKSGYISPSSVYDYITQSLNKDEQRPLFKTNVSDFVLLRSVYGKPFNHRGNIEGIIHYEPDMEKKEFYSNLQYLHDITIEKQKRKKQNKCPHSTDITNNRWRRYWRFVSSWLL